MRDMATLGCKEAEKLYNWAYWSYEPKRSSGWKYGLVQLATALPATAG